jgi:lipopolysaccharide/colanic/teichoic acid biosynthesis glycosyltransferase
MHASSYNKSFYRRVFDLFISSFGFLITLPFIILISAAIKTTSNGSIFFLQKRVGRNGRVFEIIKFRTMIPNAEKNQHDLKKLNEADGPVFKIKDDPRFTRFGKMLSRTGLDELPQLINVLKGDMSIVGPRPLPVDEAKKLNRKQKIRELVKPGITSSWVAEGSHEMSFKKWMKLDEAYIKNASFVEDISIIYKTIGIVFHSVLKL